MGGDTEPHKPVHGTTTDSRSGEDDNAGPRCTRCTMSSTWTGCREAYRLTRKDGAAGIDGVTAAAYEVQLEANLRDLLDRIKSGRYQAPPVRRAYIPKADGSQRPLGIPTFEDKVAQRAIAMVLEAIYEQDFLPCSYGFRPGSLGPSSAARPAQCHLEPATVTGCLDVDIQKYFDTMAHCHLRAFLDQTSHGWCDPADDRQVAEGRGHRRWPAASYDRRLPAGGRDLTAAFRTSTCTTCWTSGSRARCGRA